MAAARTFALFALQCVFNGQDEREEDFKEKEAERKEEGKCKSKFCCSAVLIIIMLASLGDVLNHQTHDDPSADMIVNY